MLISGGGGGGDGDGTPASAVAASRLQLLLLFHVYYASFLSSACRYRLLPRCGDGDGLALSLPSPLFALSQGIPSGAAAAAGES